MAHLPEETQATANDFIRDLKAMEMGDREDMASYTAEAREATTAAYALRYPELNTDDARYALFAVVERHHPKDPKSGADQDSTYSGYVKTRVPKRDGGTQRLWQRITASGEVSACSKSEATTPRQPYLAFYKKTAR